MKTITITIRADGRAEFIHDEQVADGLAAALGAEPVKVRQSHVEPVNRILRWLFHAIRSRVADGSALAGWTRRWRCRWRARIFNGGPTLGPFSDRAEAIDAEVAWLEDNRL